MRSNHDLRITLYDPSGSGGICHYTYQLAENLARAGCDVTVVTTEGYELSHLKRNFNIKILFKKSWMRNFVVWVLLHLRGKNPPDELYQQLTVDQPGPPASKLISLLRNLKTLRLRMTFLKAAFSFLLSRPHIVHFQWLVDRNEDYYFIKFLKLLGFKIVYTAHDLLPQDIQTPNDREDFQKIYGRVDRIIVHSKSDKKEMIQLFTIEPNKISVIPHGSYDLFYREKNVSKEVAREALGIPKEKKVILFFGLIKRYKGLEYLVEAFGEVKGKLSNLLLLIAGKIYDGDAKICQHYSHLIGQLRCRDDVMCVTEYIPFEKVGSYFSASDVVVLPYIKTYTSGVLFSAYAAGRAVVVTDTGGLSEVVVDGKSGFVVPTRDSQALAEAVIKTINSSDQIEEMGRYAKYLAETTYSWKSVALKTIDVYRSLIFEERDRSRQESTNETTLKDTSQLD